MPKSKTRNFEGFGVVTRQGHLLWQYNRPEADQAREAYERHNPQLEDHDSTYELVKLSVKLEPLE